MKSCLLFKALSHIRRIQYLPSISSLILLQSSMCFKAVHLINRRKLLRKLYLVSCAKSAYLLLQMNLFQLMQKNIRKGQIRRLSWPQPKYRLFLLIAFKAVDRLIFSRKEQCIFLYWFFYAPWVIHSPTYRGGGWIAINAAFYWLLYPVVL